MGWPIDRPTGPDASRAVPLVQGLHAGLRTANSHDAVLLDMQGRVAHRWHFPDRRLLQRRTAAQRESAGDGLAAEHPPPPREPAATSIALLARSRRRRPTPSTILGGRGVGLRRTGLGRQGRLGLREPRRSTTTSIGCENGHTIFLEWVRDARSRSSNVGAGRRPRQPEQPDAAPTMIGDDFVEVDAEGERGQRGFILWRGAPRPRMQSQVPAGEHRWEWTTRQQHRADARWRTAVLSSRDTSASIGIVDPPAEDRPGSLRWRFGWPEISHQHHASPARRTAAS